MKKIALILDLDNTLYNWMESFAASLDAQITYLAKMTGFTKKRIQESFKKVFKQHGTVEVITAANELDIWEEVNHIKAKIDHIKKHSTKIFFQTFSNNLNLYPTVLETLKWAKKNKIVMFAFSSASAFWIDFRLEQLKITNFFEKIYVLENEFERNQTFKNNIIALPKSKMKPNPFVVDKIRKCYHLQKENIYFIGDSKNEDIRTAKLAKVNDIWAQYGKNYLKKSGRLLASVTPWTASQKLAGKHIIPQYTISEFAEIKSIIRL